MQKQSKITNRGRINLPAEIRRLLGVREGDWLLFESEGKVVRIRPVVKSALSKYRGTGTPELDPVEPTSDDG